jgi:hypothetical protein
MSTNDIFTPTPEQELRWRADFSDRPPIIQDLASRFPFWKLFSLSPTDQSVVVIAYNESGTVRVLVPEWCNTHNPGVTVFGINPADLTPQPVADVYWPLSYEEFVSWFSVQLDD